MSEYKFAIQAKHLNKTYNKKLKAVNALIDFNIKIPKGSIYGLLGPNGAGKSTFINILGGLVKKDSGEVNICGINADEKPKATRMKIGIVPQELNMDPFFTPFELLELQAGLYGVRKKNRRTNEILERLSLIDQKNAYARTLSGGMRRRLLVAKSLVHNPDVVILDEPTAGVDIELRQSLWNYVRELNSQGTTICLTTHYLEEAENLCNYITIINKGKILQSNTKDNLLNLIGTKKVSFILDTNKVKIPEALIKFNPVIEKNKLLLKYNKNTIKLIEIINILNNNQISFNEINTYESDLKDVFINIINK